MTGCNVTQSEVLKAWSRFLFQECYNTIPPEMCLDLSPVYL